MVLNPRCDREDRCKWSAALETWAKLEICPLEDPDHRHSSSRNSSSRGEENSHKRPRLGPYASSSHKKARRSHKPRTIFHQALDALQMDWKDSILVKILQKDNDEIHPWNEHLPTACARIDALRTHGFDSEALKLALSIAVTLRHNQKRDHAQWLNNKENYAKFKCTASGVARKPGHACYESWIGHSLNPIGILFNTLVEPCLYPDQDSGRLGHHLDLIPAENSENSSSQTSLSSSSSPLKFFHHGVFRCPSYVELAVESALIALGQQRLMPPGLYAQEKAVKQEQRLLAKLQDLETDSKLKAIHTRQARIQLDMGPTSGLGYGIHPESIPMQTYAKYLFHTLLQDDFNLAYEVGLRAMRLPVLDEREKEELPALAAAVADHRDPDLQASSYVMNRLPRWFTIGHIESQQCGLASKMLNAAKGRFSMGYFHYIQKVKAKTICISNSLNVTFMAFPKVVL